MKIQVLQWFKIGIEAANTADFDSPLSNTKPDSVPGTDLGSGSS